MGFNYSTAFELTGVNSAREKGEGARENSGWEGYGRWERKGRELEVLIWVDYTIKLNI